MPISAQYRQEKIQSQAQGDSRLFQRLVITLILLHGSIFFLWGLSRHWGFLTSLNDLGHFDQAVYGALNGKGLLNTDLFNFPINHLGFHFTPVLYLFVPFYLIFPSVIWLTAAQATAIASAAWPIFLFARHVARSERAAFFWAASFLVNPFVLNAGAWDFHPIALAVPFIALAILAVERRNFWLLLSCCLVILLCKEHTGGIVAGLGMLWGIRNRAPYTTLFIIALGLLHGFLVFSVVMPYFSPTGEHVMLTGAVEGLGRYAWLGGTSVSEIAMTLSTRFDEIIMQVFGPLDGGGYLLRLLFPFLGLPIIGGAFLLPGMADLAAQLLSSNPMPKSHFAYHSVTLIPILAAAAIHGTGRIVKVSPRYRIDKIAGFVLIANIATGYIAAPFPLPGSSNLWAPVHLFQTPDPRVRDIKAMLPEDISVSAQGNIGSQFSQRSEIFWFPNMTEQADAIVLRLHSPTDRLLPRDPGLFGTLSHHLMMDPAEYLNAVENLLLNSEYGIIYWSDPWLVLRRSVLDRFPRQRALDKIYRLREIWIADAPP